MAIDDDSIISQQDKYYHIKHYIIMESEEGMYKFVHPQPTELLLIVNLQKKQNNSKQCLLLQLLLSLAKEEMCLLSLSSSLTGQVCYSTSGSSEGLLLFAYPV